MKQATVKHMKQGKRFDAGAFGGMLRERRLASGLGLRDLEALTGVNYGVIFRIEHGGVPNVESYLRLKEWLDASIEQSEHAGQEAPMGSCRAE
jgi:transcriptional regulator with XRE-family HTH domain